MIRHVPTSKFRFSSKEYKIPGRTPLSSAKAILKYVLSSPVTHSYPRSTTFTLNILVIILVESSKFAKQNDFTLADPLLPLSLKELEKLQLASENKQQEQINFQIKTTHNQLVFIYDNKRVAILDPPYCMTSE